MRGDQAQARESIDIEDANRANNLSIGIANVVDEADNKTNESINTEDGNEVDNPDKGTIDLDEVKQQQYGDRSF